ncbi:hypothetical protein BRADI_1g32881v3 [Brachypodium distachyon]|uniref:Uncharacterized protein n=1 Tax=Brachypodium distachyon TaxID=15368 RepID=A0A2K2DMG1_BRADI|nr:hypothetical protein BRADI_1g32881v3 [Brachypodium distachyon]
MPDFSQRPLMQWISEAPQLENEEESHFSPGDLEGQPGHRLQPRSPPRFRSRPPPPRRRAPTPSLPPTPPPFSPSSPLSPPATACCSPSASVRRPAAPRRPTSSDDAAPPKMVPDATDHPTTRRSAPHRPPRRWIHNPRARPPPDPRPKPRAALDPPPPSTPAARSASVDLDFSVAGSREAILASVASRFNSVICLGINLYIGSVCISTAGFTDCCGVQNTLIYIFALICDLVNR